MEKEKVDSSRLLRRRAIIWACRTNASGAGGGTGGAGGAHGTGSGSAASTLTTNSNVTAHPQPRVEGCWIIGATTSVGTSTVGSVPPTPATASSGALIGAPHQNHQQTGAGAGAGGEMVEQELVWVLRYRVHRQ